MVTNTNFIVKQTNRALYPKADSLRKFPENFLFDLQDEKKSQTTVIKNEKIIRDKVGPNEVRRFSLLVEPGSRATFVLEADCAVDDFSITLAHVIVKRDAYFHFVPMVRGGARIECHVRIDLVEPGAEAFVSGVFAGSREQHQGFHIVMDHQAPNTKGDILLRGVYQNKSRGVFSGLIKVEKQAQKTNSYFSDHVLLLDDAIADSQPTLEIEANDVKATHGSTTSRINDEQLFYLQSRGIEPSEARQLIVQGFLQKVLERVPQEVSQTLALPSV